MKLTRAARDARRAQIAAMVREGMAPADVAAQFGVSQWVMRRACAVHGVAVSLPRQGAPGFVRNVHESMREQEWAGICLWRRATAEACRKVATWRAGAWCGRDENECVACDEHREAMACNVSVRRVRARDEEVESWA